DREGFAGAVRRSLFDVAHLVQHGQRRIDDAGARRVDAAAQFLDGADQVVAVARLVGDQLEQDQPQLAGVEDPTAPAAPLAVLAAPAAAAHAVPADRMVVMPPVSVGMMVVNSNGVLLSVS